MRTATSTSGARRLGRAGFLGVVGVGVATLFYGKVISRATSRVTNPLSDATGLTRLVPSSGWRIYTVAGSMPSFDPATWRLRVDGLVRKPLDLTYDDLRALPRAEQVSTFHCVTGWTVGGVRWGGVRFDDLLAAARPLPRAGALHFVSAEQPYDDYLDLRQVALPDAMLAYEMDGKPLPRVHGAPVRVVIPEMYGYKNVKWVSGSRSSQSRVRGTGSSAGTTSTPGSDGRTGMASAAVAEPPRYVERFTLTERLLHWVHASAFFVLLGSGLVLYLPSLSAAVGRRPLVKDIHFWTGISWAGAILLVAALGNRRALAETVREIDLFDRDDRRFLSGDARAPQGRFNAGQKVNAILTAAFAVLFFCSGLLLWYGERDTRFRLAGTAFLHDALMYLSVVIVAGHLYLALVHRSTRHSLRGMTLGAVREDWAREHHSKWIARP